jgi:lipopolysaccharide/colanic/teichoic acid biosynthesis glycosyltransferase
MHRLIKKVPAIAGKCSNEPQSYSSESPPLWKRGLDITCILIGLPLLIPLVVGIGLLIKCVSRGPMIFLQERVGYRGRRFICFKFRTMKVGSDVGLHRSHVAELMRSNVPMVKMDTKDDRRLIPLGSLLRATGLDELPQILNVLGGQMSLVGPRPCLVYEYENYSLSQKQRFNALPGLTGLWQVCGKNKTTFSEMIALDIAYSENKSLRLDLQIMMKTLPVVVSQFREARVRRQQAPPCVSETVFKAGEKVLNALCPHRQERFE